MKFTVLVENTREQKAVKAAHGLALLIELEDQKILFDTGPSDVIMKNAKSLGIDLSSVDSVILSHGHSDHAGGIDSLRKVNKSAVIYMHESSRNPFRYVINKLLAMPINNKNISNRKQEIEPVKEIREFTELNARCKIFCNFKRGKSVPASNRGLEVNNGAWIQDDFDHEIALLIQHNKKNILFTGCSHNGVENIMESVKVQAGIEAFDYVIGGFHLYDPVRKTTDKGSYFKEFCEYMECEKSTRFYTGHCTGPDALISLKNQFGDRVESLYTGQIIEICT